MSIHEQARAEAKKRRYSLYGTDRPAFEDGFLAGHEAATRTRVVTTVTELDALLDESVLRSHDGRVATKAQNELWWLAGWNAPEYGDALADSDFLPARVLYEPEETP